MFQPGQTVWMVKTDVPALQDKKFIVDKSDGTFTRIRLYDGSAPIGFFNWRFSDVDPNASLNIKDYL